LLRDDVAYVRQQTERWPIVDGQVAFGRRMTPEENSFGLAMNTHASGSRPPKFLGQRGDFGCKARGIHGERQAYTTA
jgi:hypothetical protein